MASRESFAIGSVRVRAGSAKDVELPLTTLVTGGDVGLPVRVVHGREPGPVIWITGVIHGDEVLGVEVIRQALTGISARTLRGTILAVPVVNVMGFMTGNRYLPDRRDLNRSFPGSSRGSLASRIAHLLMTEVVSKCEVGIDVHTAADRRTNLPQIRADLDDPQTRALAEAFGAPVMLHARLRDGSLRQAALEVGARVLLYEAGEILRFDEEPIAVGVAGIRRVLSALGMIEDGVAEPPASLESRSSGWVRARGTGILHLDVTLGSSVVAGDRLGRLSDTLGRHGRVVRADRSGIVIGLTRAPIVNAGDALVHIAVIGADESAAEEPAAQSSVEEPRSGVSKPEEPETRHETEVDQ